MRAFLPILVLSCFELLAGCTKPNPNRCCTDEADCTAKGIPTGSQCEEGLVCRGNQCIAQPCDSSSSCDLSVPYCVDELCGATCTDDSQCPGFGESDVPYCIDGACVACRTSADCLDASAAVCDSGSCRACTSHSECASDLCDTDTGTCIADATIAYAAPGASSTSACTKEDPCTLTRAVAVLDSTRTAVKLAPGTYDELIDKALNQPVSLYGPATINGAVYLKETTESRLRDLTIQGFGCGSANQSLPFGSMDLARVVVNHLPHTQTAYYADSAYHCNLRLSHVSIRHPEVGAALYVGYGSTLEMDHSEIDAAMSKAQCISFGEGCTGKIVNSHFRNCAGANTAVGALRVLDAGTTTIEFSTFYNTYLVCGDGNLAVTSSNNIFLNESSDAPSDTVSGARCRFEYSLIKPQTATPHGANNLLNVDPRFVDAAMGDFHLAAGSPAIDAADPAATETTDFDGTTRPQGAGRDIGAFEYKP